MHLLGQFSGRGDTDGTGEAAVRCPAECPPATAPLLLHRLSLALGSPSCMKPRHRIAEGTRGGQQLNQDEEDRNIYFEFGNVFLYAKYRATETFQSLSFQRTRH